MPDTSQDTTSQQATSRQADGHDAAIGAARGLFAAYGSAIW